MQAWPPDLAAATASIKIRETQTADGGVIGVVQEIRCWDKLKPLELAARHLGMLQDKVEVASPIADLLREARARIRQ